MMSIGRSPGAISFFSPLTAHARKLEGQAGPVAGEHVMRAALVGGLAVRHRPADGDFVGDLCRVFERHSIGASGLGSHESWWAIPPGRKMWMIDWARDARRRRGGEIGFSPLSPGRVPRYDAAMNAASTSPRRLRIGMAGLGMIFDETYRPVFKQLHYQGLYRRDFGPVEVELAAVASRTGRRAKDLRQAGLGPCVQLRRAGRRRPNAGAGRGRGMRRHAGRPALRCRTPGPGRRQARPDREAVRVELAGAG